MNKVKFVLFSAGILLALGFAFGCSSSNDSGGNPGENGSLSSESSGGNNHSSNSIAGISSSSGGKSSDDRDNHSSSSSTVISSSSGKSSSSSSIGQSSSSGGSSSAKSSSSFVNDGKECDAIFNPDNKFCYDGVVYDKCGGNTYNPVTQGCLSGKVEEKCGSSVYSQATEFCYDNRPYAKCDGMTYNPTTHICQNKVAIPAKCNGESYNPVIQYCSNGTEKDTRSVTDTRDGKEYKITVIGTQIWMAENLNYNADGSKCYNNDPDNCTTYGRLYNWTLAKTVCPIGWHLPTNEEWNVLIGAAGGYFNAGTKLKATSGWNTGSDYKAGTDNFGFSALPGGYGDSGGGFGRVGYNGYWWSASESISGNAYLRDMFYNYDSVDNLNYGKEDYMFSVRCLKDQCVGFGYAQPTLIERSRNERCYRMLRRERELETKWALPKEKK